MKLEQLTKGARVADAIGDSTVRTVSENAKTLKFQIATFERE